MPSKGRTDREFSARLVLKSLMTHRDEIEEGVSAALAPFAKKGESVPKIGPLLDSLGRSLTAATAAMTATDDAHESEMADDVAPRLARDEAVAAVRATLMDLRGALEPLGRSVLTTFGLEGAVPEKPQEVLTTGRFVLKALQNDKLPWPKARRGITIERGAFVDELEGQVAALAKALDKVATEAKELESTRLAKDDALAHYDRVFSHAAGVAWELFKLAGKIELANRIRPSSRRPGQTEQAPEGPPSVPPGPPS